MVDDPNRETLANFEPGTTEPICQPLKTLESVLSWQPGDDCFNIATQALVKNNVEKKVRPHTLVCHDMAGGYLLDRFVQGADSSEYYRHYHWQYLDSFIYFSHYFVTIPPPGWTNAAHKHGVLMLGTFITEWDDGLERCKAFLKDEDTYKSLADKMVAITKFYNFDGWLVNIENKIEPEKVKNLLGFVEYLTVELHREIPNSKVIWYDSVIEDGSLKWQDQLNDKNRMFFDVCDAIFLNYTWNEEKLKNSVLLAGDRRCDVYVGVDVFGRNCFGGGGWNTNKAMSVISNHKLSAAIFAPGWVCEKHGHEHFVENQNRFWNLLSEFCTPNVISCLPIVTSFCHGCGTKYYRHGQVIKNKPWGNLSCQQLQPNIVNSAEDITVDYCTMDAYHGGGCLEVTGKLKSDKYTTLGIFSSSIKVDHPLLVSYTYQMIADEKDVGFCLYLRCDGGQKIISLVSDQEVGERQSQSTVSDYGIDFSDKLFNSSLPCMTDISQHSSVYATLSGDSQISLQATFHGEDISTSSKWKTRYYLVPSEEFNNDIQEIALCCYARKKEDVSSVDFTFKLGYLQIVNPISLINNSKEVSDLQLSDDQWTESTDADRNALVSGTLKWNYPSTSGVHFNIFCVGLKTDPHDNTEIDTSSRVFIGQAFVNMYRICDLCVSSGKADTPYSFKVIVQPVNNAGFTTPFKNCSTLTVNHTL